MSLKLIIQIKILEIFYKGITRLTPYVDEIIEKGSVVIELLPIRFSTFAIYYKKWEYDGTAHQISIDFKKACNLV
jgi:hypothetical protein